MIEVTVLQFIPAEPCKVVSLRRFGSHFSHSRAVLWKQFAEYVIVPINPSLPPAKRVDFCCHPTVLRKQHFSPPLPSPFSKPISCGEFPLPLAMLSFLCSVVTQNCFCVVSVFDPFQLAENRRSHMYGHPKSALSYTCENLWHYTVGLERLKKSHGIRCA